MSRIGILFDLDGTLADTAPDLVAVLNRMLHRHGYPPVPYGIARNEVSNGSVGLIRLGFGLAATAPVDEGLRQEFLDLYERMGHGNSSLFITLETIVKACSELDAVWGIVTNKPASLTAAVLEELGLTQHVAALVCGDTLPQRKPDPAPLLHAAKSLGIDPAMSYYFGDALRDIEAGRAAGMQTIATTYGYIRQDEDWRSWRADAWVSHPRRIPAMLATLTGTGS